MAISDVDIKLLWGRAAGQCSRPGCRLDLTRILEEGEAYVIGEMAHVIAKSPVGPRGDGVGGNDSYANLILLCPSCHREVDKAPEGIFPEKQLHEWKELHEKEIRSKGSDERFDNFADLKSRISTLLMLNHEVWRSLGPKSHVATSNPTSNLHSEWKMRRLDTILPNNRKICNMIKANSELLNPVQKRAYAMFVSHANSYERHVFGALDQYPCFPKEFQVEFGD